MKTTISITIDVEIKQKIDEYEINVSKACNEYLRKLIELKKEKEGKSQ